MARKILPTVVCALLAAHAFASSEVVISEFLASNSKTYPDENGQFSDWIELHNTTVSNFNIGGWFLTDDSGNLTKWRIPATNIVAGGYLVVFADGLNKTIPGAALHTSFNLSANGEYLALVKPDHSIATEFSPKFPVQVPDVSYGFGKLATNQTVISTNSLVRVRIPPNGNDGTNWTIVGYNDGAWIAGTNGVGYADANSLQADYSTVVLPMQPIAYWRMNESAGTLAPNLGSLGAAANGTYSAVGFGTAGPRPPVFNGFESDNLAPTFNGTSSYLTANNGLLSGKSTFTMCGWVNFSAAPGSRVGLFGQNDCVEFGFSAAGNLQVYTPSGSVNLAWNPALNTWYHILVSCDGSSLRIYTNAVLAASGTSTANTTTAFPFNIGGNGVFDSSGNFFTGLIDEVAVFSRALSATEITALYQGGISGSGIPLATFIKTDIGTAMSNVNASAYIRMPFTVDTATNVGLLTLRIRYNDGFVASINGVEVARANAVDPVAYNSAAITNHASSQSTDFKFNSTMLVNGSNMLAIQGLNVAANDTNFLISAELITTSVPMDSPLPVYFTAPSPGADNVGGIANPGPSITKVHHTPTVPADNEDITVTAKIAPTFFPVAQVVVRYRVMFAATDTELLMYDDGLHGDGAANDGVYGATLPISGVSTNGEMIRWYFRATDSQGNVSRWPLFTDPAGSAEFLGTIVDAPNVTSKLPVIHLFAPANILQPTPPTSQTGADSQGGGRVALFFDGEFYDNIEFNLRGNSTAGFNKKSHHVNFNPEHPFKPPYGRAELRHTSFEADYPDPAYMRQWLSFWLTEQMGIPSAYYDPVRLQLNTQFYQLASHNNVVGAEQVGWMGFDPNGALYKAAGVVVTNQYSTGNFEKKTRLWETDNADYKKLAYGICETNSAGTRRTNAFELFDVPAVLNYLVTARWAHENDDVWANMTLYRDTLGNGLWRIIPFDMNLSWGAIFYEGSTPSVIEGVQATNDIHKAHPLYGSSSCVALSGPGAPNNYNRVYDTFFQVPELRQMFLRRLRTLLDTWVKPIGTPTNSTFIEQMVMARRDLIADEAGRDRTKWGWPPKGGQCNFDPGINVTNGVSQLLSQFLIARRYHFYGKHSITNTALPIGIGNANNAGIPLAQPTNALLQIAGFEYNPTSANQGQEYIALTNPNPYALDISGWKIESGAKFTFAPGTVILSNSVIYVTPDLNAFRTRTTPPQSGQGLFVVGDYKGQLSARGETILVTDTTGRLVASNSYAGTPSLAQQYLRITELMYHPGPTNAGSPYGQEEYEYMELKNIGPVSISLIGVHFTNGLQFLFTATNAVTNLAAGQAVVLVKNPAAFVSRYGSSATIAGTYIGSLDNSGERLQLHDAIGEEILDFSYNNTWYPITDGLGFSLVIVDDTAPFNTWDQKASWRASGRINGSPGVADPAPVAVVPVLVNEVLANSPDPAVDAIELWNPTATPAPIGGWFITDDFINPKKYRINAGTTIAAGGYMVFDEHQFNVGDPLAPTNFAFSSFGDEAYLFAADASGNLLGYYHGFHFPASDQGVTFGRYLTSQTNEHFVAQRATTLGATNAGPRVGPVVISEIMFHPPDINGVDDQTQEYIELLNISSNSVVFYDTASPTNHWKLKDGIDFDFSTNTVLAPGGYLLVVSFDPQTNGPALAAFRDRYGLDANVAIVGPYSGKLDNSADHVELAHPQPVQTNGFDYVLTDKVDYDQSWGPIADGLGVSLQRIVPGDYGNDPTNWVAAAPSPGSTRPSVAPPVLTQQPVGGLLVENSALTLQVSASGGTPLYYQWIFNGGVISGATNQTYAVTNAQQVQSGVYAAIVYNSGGAVRSADALVNIRPLPRILFQTGSQTNQPGSNTTFSVVVDATAPITYQWRFNSNAVSGATGPDLLITNAQLYSNAGFYDVIVHDAITSITSPPVVLNIAVRPTITNTPVALTVLQGNTAVFKVVAGPVHPLLPLTYRWISTIGGTVNAANGVTNSSLVLTNVSLSQSNSSIRLNVANPAFPSGTNAPPVILTVLPDADHDGVWDEASTFLHLDPPLKVNGTNIVLQFTAAGNRIYQVQSAAMAGASNWITLLTVPTNVSTRVIQYTNTISDTQQVYRLTIP